MMRFVFQLQWALPIPAWPARCLGVACGLALGVSACVLADAPHLVPLVQAHAHNDYEHPHPLMDALEQGFSSVEADVHLADGELLVAHDAEDTNADRTLRKLYLQPLLERTRAHRGRVHEGGPTFTLLVDFKTADKDTYVALDRELRPFREMLVRYEDGKRHDNAVEVIISGNRPTEIVAAESIRYVGIDGRLQDLHDASRRDLMPLISDNWNLHFRWRGEGEMTAEETAKLRSIVETAHGQGRRLRFWAVPDQANSWKLMADHGVDLINTDNLAGLARFLRERDPGDAAGR